MVLFYIFTLTATAAALVTVERAPVLPRPIAKARARCCGRPQHNCAQDNNSHLSQSGTMMIYSSLRITYFMYRAWIMRAMTPLGSKRIG